MSRVLTYAYDEVFSPPFPVIEIEVVGYNGAAPLTVTAFVDSGADGTLIPLNILQAVGASYEDSVQMRGAAGGMQTVDLYLVAVTIGTHIIRAVHAVATNSEALIGRDVLNELMITLNGPAHMTEIHFE